MRDLPIAIAVLPFRDLTGDPDTEFFARGFVEDLAANLTRFRDLRVVAAENRAGVAPGEAAAADVGSRWGLQYLVEGSVRRRADVVRISARLVRVDGGESVWAESFDAPADGAFASQDAITATVAGRLAVRLDELHLDRARNASPDELRAYDGWLRGLEYLRRGTLEDDEEARNHFRRALEIDPGYARAWAGLSISHFNEWTCQAWHLFDESQDGAFRSARRAADLDDRDAMVHAVLARLHRFRHEHAAADRHAARALALNPNDPNVLIHVAIARLFGGEHEVAHGLATKAIELNPLHGPWYAGVDGWSLFLAGRPGEALPRLQQAGGSIVNFGAYRAACHALLGDPAAARAEYAAFEQDYRAKIAFGREPEAGEAVEWAVQVEPFRRLEDSRRMPDALRAAGLAEVDVPAAIAGRPATMVRPADIPRPPGNAFLRDGDTWTLDYEGRGARLAEVKGFHDIARLLAEPGVAIHCLELCGEPPAESRHDVLDPRARADYRRRIDELREEIERAEADNDLARAAPSRVELERVVDELARATGLGGRSQRLGDRAERARTAATWRIRSAIKKIRAAHPRLGQHLENSLRTGVFCTYAPEAEVTWAL